MRRAAPLDPTGASKVGLLDKLRARNKHVIDELRALSAHFRAQLRLPGIRAGHEHRPFNRTPTESCSPSKRWAWIWTKSYATGANFRPEADVWCPETVNIRLPYRRLEGGREGQIQGDSFSAEFWPRARQLHVPSRLCTTSR